jgi:hypothetical protein
VLGCTTLKALHEDDFLSFDALSKPLDSAQGKNAELARS